MALTCTYFNCPATATRVLAWPMLGGRCLGHAAEIEQSQGGLPAGGPALSADAEKIGGIRR